MSVTFHYGVYVGQPVTITTSSLPGASIGSAYSATLNATGGSPPYVWTLYLGVLPPGLTLSTSGVISGTPTTAGTYNFTILVTDHNGAGKMITVKAELK